jgi:hypothetical protein
MFAEFLKEDPEGREIVRSRNLDPDDPETVKGLWLGFTLHRGAQSFLAKLEGEEQAREAGCASATS